VRLWSAREHAALADFEAPEVRRVDLAGTVLALHAWGKPDPRAFGWYEPPPEQALLAAERLLAMLGALDREAGRSITPLGRRLMSLPVHPALARCSSRPPSTACCARARRSPRCCRRRTSPAADPPAGFERGRRRCRATPT
jgi:ATP-dependent helicase HrpB